MTMSDRIAILDHGELQQVGTPREVYNRPRNLFVGQFIGSPSMNVFDVEYEPTDDGGQLVGDVDLSIDSERAERIEAAGFGRMKLGIRPEDISASETREEDTISAGVDIVEPLGARDLLYFDIGGDDEIVSEGIPDPNEEGEAAPDVEVEERKAFIEPEAIPEDTDEVFLHLDMDQAHLFDAETGLSLAYADERREVAPSA